MAGIRILRARVAVLVVAMALALFSSPMAGLPVLADDGLVLYAWPLATTYTAVGEAVEIQYTLHNDSGSTLTDVRVAQTGPTATDAFACAASLAQDAWVTCDGTYTITAADLSLGSVTIAAHAYGATPSGATTSNEDQVTLWAVRLAVTKVPAPGAIHAGDTVTYVYTVTNANSAGVLVNDVALRDDMGTPDDTTDDARIMLDGLTDVDGNGEGDLAAGASATGSLDAALDETTTNVATATAYFLGRECQALRVSAQEPSCQPVVVQGGASATVEVLAPAVALTKTPSDDELITLTTADVTYTYVVANIGDTALLDIALVDDMGTRDDTADDVTVVLTTGLTDEDSDGVVDDLAVGATATGTLLVSLAKTTTNVAVVTAHDALNLEVSAEATASVKVSAPVSAVVLRDWAPTADTDGVTLTWVTLREDDVQAFRVYRSPRPRLAGGAVVAAVPAQGSASGGHEERYSYRDGGLSAGTYYYWLAEVRSDGTESLVAGPSAAVVGLAGEAMPRMLFLPLLAP